jgi:hypothetical protein
VAAKIKSGLRKRRVKRPVEKKSYDRSLKGYDSNWEYELHTGILKDWDIHTDTVDYIVEHTYHPDFIKKIKGTTIFLEAKGRFWDHAEHNKYVWVKKALPKKIELVFLFADPAAPMPGATRRKDGTKRSHAEWAERNGFRWYSVYNIPKEWIDSSTRLEINPDYPEEQE